MSKGLIVVLVFLGVLVLFGFSLFLGYFSFTSSANEAENGIKAQYQENQNVFDNGYKKVVEAAQITDKQADDLKELYTKVAQGLTDQKQFLLALGAFNPNMDQGTYKKVQQLIETYHNDFQARQTDLIARKNKYQNLLTVAWSGRFFNQFAGYPHIDLTKFDIVTSDKTQDAFTTKKAEPLDIYKRK